MITGCKLVDDTIAWYIWKNDWIKKMIPVHVELVGAVGPRRMIFKSIEEHLGMVMQGYDRNVPGIRVRWYTLRLPAMIQSGATINTFRFCTWLWLGCHRECGTETELIDTNTHSINKNTLSSYQIDGNTIHVIVCERIT